MTGGQSGMQTTLGARATISGIGVHSARGISLTMHPAEAGSGVSFYRTNVDDGRDREIPADFRHVSATDLSTAVGVAGGSGGAMGGRRGGGGGGGGGKG